MLLSSVLVGLESEGSDDDHKEWVFLVVAVDFVEEECEDHDQDHDREGPVWSDFALTCTCCTPLPLGRSNCVTCSRPSCCAEAEDSLLIWPCTYDPRVLLFSGQSAPSLLTMSALRSPRCAWRADREMKPAVAGVVLQNTT